MTGPAPGETVWLSHAGSTVAHSVMGSVSTHRWTTRCGRVIQRVTRLYPNGPFMRPQMSGSLVSWGHLDHSVVRPCKGCWR